MATAPPGRRPRSRRGGVADRAILAVVERPARPDHRPVRPHRLAPACRQLPAGGGGKPFELARHLLRLFRSLDSWLGQDDQAARSWLATPNLDLGAAPIDLIASVRGLLRTGDYVDALRART